MRLGSVGIRHNILVKRILLISLLMNLASSCSEAGFEGAGKSGIGRELDIRNNADDDSKDGQHHDEGASGTVDGRIGGEPLTLKDRESVVDFCAAHSSIAKSMTIMMDFPADNVACEWGRNGNLPRGQSIRAQQEYKFLIELDGEVSSLCSFDINMQKSFTRFDDDITLVLDGYAFAGDYLSRAWLLGVAGLNEENGLLLYDKSKVIGQSWPNAQQWKEDGVTGAFVTRQNSATQREGSFDLRLSEVFVNKMPRNKLRSSQHTFAFFLSGNDHDTDCRHDGFVFRTNITYIPR